MQRRILVAPLALLAAVLVLGAGCSGDDSPNIEGYEASLVEARNDIDESLTQVSEARTRTQFVDRMKQASVVVDRAADNLDDTDVPEQFEDEHSSLTSALHSLSSDLNATAEQLELTPELFNTEGLAFEGWSKANQILKSLEQQGVKVEPLPLR